MSDTSKTTDLAIDELQKILDAWVDREIADDPILIPDSWHDLIVNQRLAEFLIEAGYRKIAKPPTETHTAIPDIVGYARNVAKFGISNSTVSELLDELVNEIEKLREALWLCVVGNQISPTGLPADGEARGWVMNVHKRDLQATLKDFAARNPEFEYETRYVWEPGPNLLFPLTHLGFVGIYAVRVTAPSQATPQIKEASHD